MYTRRQVRLQTSSIELGELNVVRKTSCSKITCELVKTVWVSLRRSDSGFGVTHRVMYTAKSVPLWIDSSNYDHKILFFNKIEL